MHYHRETFTIVRELRPAQPGFRRQVRYRAGGAVFTGPACHMRALRLARACCAATYHTAAVK